MESIREAYDGSLSSQNEAAAAFARSNYQKMIRVTAAHEMGHQPGHQSAEQDHAEGKIMSAGLQDVSLTTFHNAYFSPATLHRFRNCKQWSE
jgi:hypothetical protein